MNNINFTMELHYIHFSELVFMTFYYYIIYKNAVITAYNDI